MSADDRSKDPWADFDTSKWYDDPTPEVMAVATPPSRLHFGAKPGVTTRAMSAPIPFPCAIGGTITLPAMTAIPDTPSDKPVFMVGDICSFPPFDRYRFRVARINGNDVTFERVA